MNLGEWGERASEALSTEYDFYKIYFLGFQSNTCCGIPIAMVQTAPDPDSVQHQTHFSHYCDRQQISFISSSQPSQSLSSA